MNIPYLYQLQNADYASLSATDFRVAVVDPDDSGLTAPQVADLQASQDKLLYAYASIGEAESYRDYWQDSWTTSPPDYVLGENTDWEGNFRVEFWNADWQQIVYDRVDAALAAGYDGVYLDIVDGYTVDEVIAAYPGTQEELRQEMIDFVTGISAHAKAQNPDFAIIPQNAVGLLGATENGPDDGPNTGYLEAIDGLGVEDLWFNDDDVSDWTQGDLDYIALAQAAGKFVLATSYPQDDANQEAFLANAIAEGLIPFAAERDLTGVIDAVNETTEAAMEDGAFNAPWVDDGTGDGGASELTVHQFAVQYSDANAVKIAASPYDLVIVEGKPGDAATADLTDAEVASLAAGGTEVIGYVSVGQTDDARPYWDPSWTDDGTDTGTPTDAAPSWLGEQADSFAAAIVEFWDPEWQALVIEQVEELATRGYTGVFLDNILSYYEIASLRGELGTDQATTYAQEMISLVEEIAAAGRAINEDFRVIPNGGPYILGDAGHAADSTEAAAYYDAVDAIMAESFFGLYTGTYDAAAIDAFQQSFAARGIDVLALEYSTDAEAIVAFAEAADALGFSASVSADMALDTLPVPLEAVGDDLVLNGTGSADELYGAGGDDALSGRSGDDLLVGAAGDDFLEGGRGSDELHGGAGDDLLHGNRGGDYLDGGDGADTLAGGGGGDDLMGGAGADVLVGGKGQDELFGGAGADVLKGGKGHDYLQGGSGADTLTGGMGDDELSGGAGADRFVFAASAGWDVIDDFDAASDALMVKSLDLVDAFETEEALVLDFGANTQVELTGLTLDDLATVQIEYA